MNCSQKQKMQSREYKSISGKSQQLLDFPFPPKRIINGSKIIQERIDKLSEFLQIAVKLNPVPVELFTFFDLDKNTSITSVQYYSGNGDDGELDSNRDCNALLLESLGVRSRRLYEKVCATYI